MKLERTQAWTENKLFIPAIFGAMTVMHADILYSFLYLAGNEELVESFDLGETKQWIDRYKECKFYKAESFFELGLPLLTPLLTWTKEEYLPLLSEPSMTSECATEMLREKFETWVTETFVNNFNGPLYVQNEVSQETLTRVWQLKTAEEAFFLRITLRCLIEHKMLPIQLMRRARQGDIDALDTILRLDKAAIADPLIGKIWVKESRNRKGVRFQKLVRALASGRAQELTRQRFKVVLAGAIKKAFEAFGSPISYAEIRGLFDDYARDIHPDDPVILTDCDLPISLEAFERAVRREVEKWQTSPIFENLPQPTLTQRLTRTKIGS